MKKITCIILIILFCNNNSFSQNTIQGDRLLEIIGKPVSDPLVQQFRQQEGFTTDYWNNDFTIYTDYGYSGDRQIAVVQLLNGQKKFQSEQRYGYYRKQLPLQLSWAMSRSTCEAKLGAPVKIWPSSPNTLDYAYAGWKIRIEYENNLPVMINFQKDPDYVPKPRPILSSTTPIKVDTADGSVIVNWLVLKKLITSCSKLKSFTTKDSVDYMSQVYYATPYKVDGFLRTAIKHTKKTNEWFYEAYLKAGSDSEKVRTIFRSLYNDLKQVLKDSTGSDFLAIGVAKDYISESPMNWLVGWTLSPSYKVLPAGLGSIKITLLLSGMKDSFKKNVMDYTIKIYIANYDVRFDFWGWDKPN
jgi:hypothetical protein